MSVPTVQVLLDNFLGAFPYDITTYVREVEGFTWGRGTPDELSAPTPGPLSIRLDNTDGRFTFGAGAPYSPGTDQQIRVIVNGVNRWTGKVQSWPTEWPGGDDTFATATVTAIDDLARAQRRTLRSALEEEILADLPTAYFTMGEADGATQAGDSSGNGIPSLTPWASTSGTAVTFGGGTGPSADGLTASQFLGGQALRMESPTNVLPSAWSVEVWLGSVTAPPGAVAVGVWATASTAGTTSLAALTVNSAGQVIGAGIVGPNICDGLTHQVVLTYDGGVFTALYVDGAFIGSAGAAGGSQNILILGNNATANAVALTATVSHFATYGDDISVTRVAAHYSAGTTNLTGETPAARLTRVAGYMGLATGSLDTAGATTMGPAAQGGKSVLDVFSEVAAATGGVVFMNGTGQLTSRNGITITADLTPSVSLDANYAGEDTVAEADMSQVLNTGFGRATSSENMYAASNAFSIAVHGVYRDDLEWNVSTDAQALDRLNWRVATYAGSQSRVPSLTLDLLSLSGGALTNALTLEVGQFLSVAGMPTQSPSGTLDLIVLGISETVTASDWFLTVNCVKHNLYAAWILGDALWGVLDATTKLYF